MADGNTEKTYLFDNPKNVQRFLNVFYAICALLLLLDVIVHRHTVHPWEGLWGFYAFYGFAGCVALVLIAKWMRTFLMRSEDYYDTPGSDNNNDTTIAQENGAQSKSESELDGKNSDGNR